MGYLNTIQAHILFRNTIISVLNKTIIIRNFLNISFLKTRLLHSLYSVYC